MKICAVVFTYPGDYPKAIRLTQNMKDYVDDIFFCIESKHKDVPLPNWVTPLVFDFDRCFQLHGTEAIIGMKKVYTQLIDNGYDAVIKLDSDTLVLRPDQFITPLELGSDFVYIKRYTKTKEGEHVRRCNGCCYALSANAVKLLNEYPSNIFDAVMYQNDRHEDMVFSTLLTNIPEVHIHEVNKSKVWWSVMPYRKSDCIVCHFGYCDIARIDEELKQFAPLSRDIAFSKETNDFIKTVIEYCTKNNIPMKEYKNLYDKDGNEITEVKKENIVQSEIKKNDISKRPSIY